MQKATTIILTTAKRGRTQFSNIVVNTAAENDTVYKYVTENKF